MTEAPHLKIEHLARRAPVIIHHSEIQ